MPKTLAEEIAEAQEAGKDFLYTFCKGIGVIWLIKRIPFLELKGWVKEREERQ